MGVLASGRGTNLQAIIDAIERGELAATIAVVVSDRDDAEALARAERHGLEAVWLDPEALPCEATASREAARARHEARLISLLWERRVDLVVLAGYMRLVGPALLEVFPWRVMNIHPALLPAFPGKEGHRQALEHGVKVSGCTVHFVDGGVDTGPIILQKAVPVAPHDTPETLAERIRVEEHRLYPEAIRLFAEGRLRVVEGRRVETLPAARPTRRRRALLSVHDKTGLIDFARGLAEAGFDLISSGGTAWAIAEAGLPVTPVEKVTGFPEMLGGRVKTLHPAIHGGILARRDLSEHMAVLESHSISPIDLVAVNLYPFQATVNRLTERAADSGLADTAPGAFAEAIENIDIGGPTLVRSAAKNHEAVVVVTDPTQYGTVLEHLRRDGEVPAAARRELALAAFRHTAFYDATIAAYLAGAVEGDKPGRQAKGAAGEPDAVFPDRLVVAYEKALDLRYGENPHQRAAFYRLPLRRDLAAQGVTLLGATQFQGKELSFNNIGDAEAAIRCVGEFTEGPAAVAVKHANPCGAAVGPDILAAYRLCYASDPVSIFGGIVALNRAVTPALAAELAKVFLEVILAPAFEPEALAILARKPDLRLLALPVVGRNPDGAGAAAVELRSVPGGLLVQTPDVIRVTPEAWHPVTARRPTAPELQDLWLAWRVCKHVKSNAITVARGGQLLGVGAGQMNRVDSVRLAVGHAGNQARGAALASDAFFPFPDSVEVAATAGVTAIVQPGGSLKDAESIKAADAAGIAMVLTGERHFRH